MAKTNEWLTNQINTAGEIKVNIDSSFGLFLAKAGGTVSDLTIDGSLIIKGYNDASLFWISVDAAGDPSANVLL